MNANSWTQNPVLLHGCRNSGTTRALNLLDNTQVSGNAGDVLLGYRHLLPGGKLVLIGFCATAASPASGWGRRIWRQTREAMTLTHTVLSVAEKSAVHPLPYKIITVPVTNREAIRRLRVILGMEFNEGNAEIERI